MKIFLSSANISIASSSVLRRTKPTDWRSSARDDENCFARWFLPYTLDFSSYFFSCSHFLASLNFVLSWDRANAHLLTHINRWKRKSRTFTLVLTTLSSAVEKREFCNVNIKTYDWDGNSNFHVTMKRIWILTLHSALSQFVRLSKCFHPFAL